MLTTQELLTAAKSAQNIPSNYRLARVLGVPDNTVQRWHSGKGYPADDMAARLAELAGLDAGQVVASIRAEREGAGPMRDLWASVATRLARAGAAAAVAGVAVVGAPDARAHAPAGAGAATASLCVMSTRRLLKSAQRWLQAVGNLHSLGDSLVMVS